jgi:hypothetical protein
LLTAHLFHLIKHLKVEGESEKRDSGREGVESSVFAIGKRVNDKKRATESMANE